MRPLIETVSAPSGFDSLDNYMGPTDFGALYGFLTQTRDSAALERSNFISALALLGGESETVEVHRFGHWACGWWEIIALKHGSAAFAIAETLEAELDDYPVVDESHFADLEFTESAACWAGASLADRIAECARFGVSRFAARRDDIPETPSGELMFNC